nr:GNAT family N-acetyltransferase [Aurantimonas marina]
MRLLTTTVTSLDMCEPPRTEVPPPPCGESLAVTRVRDIRLDSYRMLYRALGDAHHWTSRLLPDERLSREIHNDSTRIFVLLCDEIVAGWFEIEMRPALREARIVHFGILPAYRGRGFADYLLSKAIAAGFAEGARRLTLETNTLDHPAALPLYRKHGFRPYAKREVQTPAIETASRFAAKETT